MDFSRALPVPANVESLLSELDRETGETFGGLRETSPIPDRNLRRVAQPRKNRVLAKTTLRRRRGKEDDDRPPVDEDHPQRPETDAYREPMACIDASRRLDIQVVGSPELQGLGMDPHCYVMLAESPWQIRRARMPTKSQIRALAPDAILFPFLTEETDLSEPTAVDIEWLRRRMRGNGAPSLVCHPFRAQHPTGAHPNQHTRELAPLFYERAAALLYMQLMRIPFLPVVELAVYGSKREPIGLCYSHGVVRPKPLFKVKYRL